ncbi:MAG: glycosyltransferase [Fimbriimonadaceae bacterium]|nr:glycosyltransferase [Fimbriimonadaceae bacterium]QYK56839.1 MAG: glycosyltransferase [Fimbriimonadaceae bacterium]
MVYRRSAEQLTAVPRVSVLVTCYNHIRYVGECLDSIYAQDYTDFEVIALDDGSQDGTREFLQSDTRPKTLVFNETNLGTYGTLNAGLERATGEFIAIMNDDDRWGPEKLRKQVALMDAHAKVGLVHTNGRFIDGAGKVTEGSPLGFEFPRTETGDVLLALAYANKIIASAALVRRQCFEELGGFNTAYFGSGDWEMWIRISEKYEVGYIDEFLTDYRVHGENASHKLERIWRDDETLRSWLAPRMESYKHRFSQDALNHAIAHNWACLGTVKTLNGKAAEGRAAYAESLRINPSRWQSRLRYLATFLPTSLFRRLL